MGKIKTNWICDCDIIQLHEIDHCPRCNRYRKKVFNLYNRLVKLLAMRYNRGETTIRYHFSKGRSIKEIEDFYELTEQS